MSCGLNVLIGVTLFDYLHCYCDNRSRINEVNKRDTINQLQILPHMHWWVCTFKKLIIHIFGFVKIMNKQIWRRKFIQHGTIILCFNGYITSNSKVHFYLPFIKLCSALFNYSSSFLHPVYFTGILNALRISTPNHWNKC